jgi:hypothetical protein
MSLDLICNLCNNPGSLKKCGICKKVAYCSEVCQKLDWKIHKSACALMTKLKVCNLDEYHIDEKSLVLNELNDHHAWQTCPVPILLGKNLLILGIFCFIIIKYCHFHN